MPTTKNYPHELRVGIDDELEGALIALVARRKENKAVVVRRILKKAIAEEHAVDSIDILNSAIRKAMKNELKPLEDRLAKLIAKSAIAGATSMYLNTQAISDLGLQDAILLYNEARKKAIAYLREPLSERE